MFMDELEEAAATVDDRYDGVAYRMDGDGQDPEGNTHTGKGDGDDGDDVDEDEDEDDETIATEYEKALGKGLEHPVGNRPGLTGSTLLLSANPTDLLLDPVLHSIRSWTGTSGHELTLEQLALSMYEEGQQERVRTYPSLTAKDENGDPRKVIYIGERRCAAAEIVQQEWEPGFEVLIEHDPTMTAEKALQLCGQENLVREDLRPLEKARLIELVRKQNGWTGSHHTADVAAWLKVSPATIANCELLAKAAPEVIGRLEDGTLSYSDAVATVRSKKGGQALTAEQQAELVGKAAEIAEKEAVETVAKGKSPKLAKPAGATDKEWMKATRAASKARREKEAAEKKAAKVAAKAADKPGKTDAGGVKSTVDEPETPQTSQTASKPAAEPLQGKPAITSRHLRKAKEETGLADAAPAPKMAYAVELVGALIGPTYPEVMNGLFRYFVKWGRGGKAVKGVKPPSDKGLIAAFDDVADQIPKAGKRPVAETVKVTKVTPKPAPKPPAADKTAVVAAAKAKKAAADKLRRSKPKAK